MLKPCLGCARLVRGAETACPFCGRAITVSPLPVFAPRRLKRAAAIAAVAAITACGGETQPTPDAGDASIDAPVKDSATKDVIPDAPNDGGTTQDVIAVPPYGVPPGDGG